MDESMLCEPVRCIGGPLDMHVCTIKDIRNNFDYSIKSIAYGKGSYWFAVYNQLSAMSAKVLAKLGRSRLSLLYTGAVNYADAFSVRTHPFAKDKTDAK